MKLNERIIQLTGPDLNWNFESGKPYFNTISYSPYKSRRINVDPFPCSQHNIELLTSHIEKIETAFPVGSCVRYYVFPFEIEGRTNAWASSMEVWDEEGKKKTPIESDIVFSGKRTIIHPAMTKYLVAHEYGHVVDKWIQHCMKKEKETNNDQEDIFHKEYADMRGIPMSVGYGGGRWIDAIVEIIADDFRIIVGKTDIDFYPHSCTHPLESPEVKKFWKAAFKKYSFKG